jgi:RND family efflux transporter MFP subunit
MKSQFEYTKNLLLIAAIALSTTPFAMAQTPPAAPVVVDTVREQSLQKPVTLVGAVEPVRKSVIASEVEGLVESFPAEEGVYVNKGDLIAKFITTNIEIDLKESKASKSEAQARYQLAKQDQERFKELQEKGVASIKQYDDARAEKAAWGARIGQFQAQIESHEYDLNKSEIKAPFSGYITREFTEVGQWVQKGGPVVELIDTETLEIRIDMPERYISKIKKGGTVAVDFDALPGAGVQGEISSLVPQADSESRTFPVKVTIDNEDGAVKSGMVARVSFPIGEPANVKLVPKDAIVTQNNANFIYVVIDGAVQPIPVTTGTAYDDRIEVLGPVETGQKVVIRGNERLMPNQAVKIVNEDTDAKDKVN